MKRTLARLAIMTTLTGLAQAATQATYYVDPDLGMDSNVGSLAAPFETLKKARDTAQDSAGLIGDHACWRAS